MTLSAANVIKRIAGFCRYLQVLGGGATAKLSVGAQYQAIVRLLVGEINSHNRVGL
jgi:hypothetical protein